MSNCYKCGHALSERARFCSACKSQVRCKSCGEALEPNAVACEMCGEDVTVRDGQILNRIKYTEDRKGRTFEAEFTDRVGESVGGTFAALLSKNGVTPPIKQAKPLVSSNQGIFNYAEEVEEAKHADADNQPLQLPAPVEIKTDVDLRGSVDGLLQSLFEQTDNGWILEETELKATNKGDYMRRVTCLFLYFQHEKGILPVPRPEVLAMLNHCGVYDATVRRWFKEEKSLMHATPKDLKLKLPGTQRAKEILAEMLNDDIPPGWKIGTKGKGGRKAGSKKDKSNQDFEE